MVLIKTISQVIDMYWNSMGHIMIQFNDQQYSIATLTQDLQLNIQQVDDLFDFIFLISFNYFI